MKIIIFVLSFYLEKELYFIVKAVVIYLILKRSYLQMVFYLKRIYALYIYLFYS